MYWVGMNMSWMVLIDGRGSWMLVDARGGLHSFVLLTASVAPPTLVAAVAAVFNVQSVVYFVCWLNKCVVRMTNTMFWKLLHGPIILPRTVRSAYYFL